MNIRPVSADVAAAVCLPQVGLFSLGIIPYINASIVLQLMSAAFPALKKMQREEGPQGRARFQYYQKLAAFVFAIAQVRQLHMVSPVCYCCWSCCLLLLHHAIDVVLQAPRCRS